MEQHEQSQQNILQSSFFTKVKTFWQVRKGPLIFLLLLLLFLPLIYSGVIKNYDEKKNPVSASQLVKTWDVQLIWNKSSQTLQLDTIAIRDGVAVASPFTDSPYVAQVLDANGKALFQTHFDIGGDFVNDIGAYSDNEIRSIPVPPPIENVDILFGLPYIAEAKEIVIFKDTTVLLQITPPKLQTSILPYAYAEVSATCRQPAIVFVGIGYSDENAFGRDADFVKDTVFSAPPIAAHREKFNTTRRMYLAPSDTLGCIQDNQLQTNCIRLGAKRDAIMKRLFDKYPDLPHNSAMTKFALLVNTPVQSRDGYYESGLSEIGGYLSVMSMQLEPAKKTINVLHEIGGHQIGKLHDRYVTDGADSQQEGRLDAITTYPSNCSINPEGEEDWKKAREVSGEEKNAYLGCGALSNVAYAPARRTCENPLWGNKDTVMSLMNCAVSRFDKVEQWWLENKVLSRYTACGAGSPAPTNTPVPSGSPAPTRPGSAGPSAAPVPTTASAGPTSPPTGGGSGHLVCYPSGGVDKRYDADTLIIENKVGRDVTIWIQQNYCDTGGRARRDGDPPCATYLGRKTDTIKANEKKSYKMGTLLSCKNNSLNINTVNTSDGGCYRNDNNQLWSGGQAFADKFVPKGSGACSAVPTDGERVVRETVTASSLGSVDGSTPPSAATTTTPTPSPKIICKEDPACTADQRSLHACQLICTQQ